MKKKFEVFSMHGDGDKVLKAFKNEPEAVAFARSHEDIILTKKDTDGRTYVWDARNERWEIDG